MFLQKKIILVTVTLIRFAMIGFIVSTLFSSALIFRIFQGKIVRPSLSVPKGRMDFPPVAPAKVTVAARFWETRK